MVGSIMAGASAEGAVELLHDDWQAQRPAVATA